ncbi:MAG: hypothetical protein KAJ51_05685 [Thermoplasmata archaeon]|nr:hypothetical protein [Thermoplasmata archaeon]
MADQNDDDTHETRSRRIREGIERARASGRKPGRPSIIDMKRNPEIGAKALELRSQGLSWAQIATELEIGRTTARTLVKEEQKKKISSPTHENNPSMPKPMAVPESKTRVQIPDLLAQDDVLSKLPKSFQIFLHLSEKARKAQEKGEGDLNQK